MKALVDAVKAGNIDGLLGDLRARRAGAGRHVGSGDRSCGTARSSPSPSKEQWHSTTRATTARRSSSATSSGRFPVPLVKEANGWRFDTAAGKEEVIARRIGRNELAAIRSPAEPTSPLSSATRRTDTTASRRRCTHRSSKSDTGQQNGLYWPHRTARSRVRLVTSSRRRRQKDGARRGIRSPRRFTAITSRS